MQQPTAIDLFSGGGGLTVGLKQAGFKVISAVEIEPHAAKTYQENHPEVKLLPMDIRSVDSRQLLGSSANEVDLIAGCPPCQGFSSLTAKYQRVDPRNQLIDDMSKIIRELTPLVVMVENVPGLATRGKAEFGRFIQELECNGYIVEWGILQVADYGVPQLRRRLVLLAGRGFRIGLPAPTHSRLGQRGTKPWVTLEEAIGAYKSPVSLRQAHQSGGPQSFNWHVVRDISAKNIQRFHALKPGVSRSLLPEHLRPDCHKNRDDGFVNVYGRLSWNQPSVTVTGGCTTPSKGRFGHPEELRTISVREAATIQTFPSDYIIATDFMDYACRIIGNALPCLFAKVLAEQCYRAMQEYSQRLSIAQPSGT
ncbi:MAG: DNA cytosine methyltransferase [Selenomonadales bacterium]|jgi:DNA (cytosine-5)-methyltransferase 1|nr:DNA cytosine methyltransferase [Selenomonadales bacterium]